MCSTYGIVAARAPAASSARGAQFVTPVDGEVVAQINAFRASVGLPPFTLSPALTALALKHAQDMLAKGYFDHDEPGGPTAQERLGAFYAREGYKVARSGENIALSQGPGDAASFVQGWIDDPPHRDILLGQKDDPLYSNVGVAVLTVESAPGVYAGLGQVSVAVVEVGPPQPVAGVSVIVAPVAGVVLVRRPGATSFSPIAAGSVVDAGTEIDTRRGRVRLTSVADDLGNLQTADFYSGRFVVSYAPDTGAPAPALLTDLRLTGSLAGCKKTKKKGQSARRLATAPETTPKKPATKPKQPTTRALWGSGAGRFRTSNGYASAAVRGTVWLTRETCSSTLVRVVSGTVDVFDIKRNVHRSVTAGQIAVVRKSK
jgi:Cysteine-rich secretory protein family